MSTKLAAIVGWPVEHSLSPRLHGFWLEEHGIDGAYVPLAVKREDFAHVIGGLIRAGFAGANVTVPHKQAAFALSHELDEAAEISGAANLLVFGADGRVLGRNTDAAGLGAALAAELGSEILRDKIAIVAGSGGAARATVLVLSGLGAREIRIVSRNDANTAVLVRNFTGKISSQLRSVLWKDWAKAAAGTALFVNATSAGMKGLPPLDLPLGPLPKEAAVCDVVYNPLDTPLLEAARKRGHRVVDGLGMLMHQAVPSFAAFYGVTPAVTPALRAELEKALGHGC